MKDELDGITIQEGYFLGIKKYGYWYMNNEGQRIEQSTFAGVTRNSLTFSEVIKLSQGMELKKEIPVRFFKSLNSLDISVKPTHVTVSKSYSKKLVENEYNPLYVHNLTHNLDYRTKFTKIKNRINKILNKYLKRINPLPKNAR
jgi:hypothetical protein